MFQIVDRMFEFAAEHEIPVDMCWKDGDILKWAIDQESRECVDYVLKKLTSKYATLEQTGRLLKLHFNELISKFPLLVEDYLRNDRFCFEYGR